MWRRRATNTEPKVWFYEIAEFIARHKGQIIWTGNIALHMQCLVPMIVYIHWSLHLNRRNIQIKSIACYMRDNR